MRPACFARAPQRCTSRLSKHFLLTFQEDTTLSKTRNQLRDNDPASGINVGVWTHIAFTYSSTDGLRSYINCVQQTADGPAGTMYPITTLGTLFGSRNTSSDFFKGAMDDVKLYNRALPVAEVCQVMRESSLGESRLLPPPSLAGLLAPLAGNTSGFFHFFPPFR